MTASDKVMIYGTGDVAVNRADKETAFPHVAATLAEPDILFAQLETNFSLKGSQFPTGHGAQHGGPEMVDLLKKHGFDVLSFASNHALDLGPDALLDTIDIAKKAGFAFIGVGKNIDEARQPAILERKGANIGFLAYNSILPPGYWATPSWPGCAPMRVRTFYEQYEIDQPGSPPETYTYALEEDLEAMVQDVKKLRPQVDVLVMSIHWGIHFMPAKLAMYQRQVAHAAIDAGVDLILGHHTHILKGIEVYKGKAIFYSLGNFCMDSSIMKTWPKVPKRWREYWSRYGFKGDPEMEGRYPFPPDSRKTMIAKCLVSNRKIEQISFLPVYINKFNQPTMLSRDDGKFNAVQEYMTMVTEDQELGTRFTARGNEVVVET